MPVEIARPLERESAVREPRPSRSALMLSWVLKAKLITLIQPANFAFSSRRSAKPRNFRTAKLRCGLPDIAGDRPSAEMISDYCDFTMSSTFSATGQLLDVKRASDRKLARLRRRFGRGSAAVGSRDGSPGHAM